MQVGNNLLVSVIIPIYNVDKYLQECVDSILVQTYDNLEIILVDDGSTDSSPQICEEYASKDSRIKVIHNQNGGPANARNTGLDVFTGGYLVFVDSDDIAAPDMIECLYSNMLKHSADISCCNICGFFANDDIKTTGDNSSEIIVLTGEQAVEGTLTKRVFPAPYAKLYKRYIFDGIRFPIGKLHEDSWIIADVFMAARTIAYDLMPKYYYRQRENSIIRTYDISTRILPELEMHEWRQSRIKELCPDIIEFGEAFLYRRYAQAARRVMADEDGYGKTDAGREVLSSVFARIEKNSKRYLKNAHIKKSEKLQICLLRINTFLYELTLSFVICRKKIRQKKQQRTKAEKVLFE